jgi:tetratricopeptide (TPR) repeat protein
MTSIRSLTVVVLVSLAPLAHAQFLDNLLGSKVTVVIDHPAELPLKVSTIALAEPEGRCGESILTRIESDFVQSGVSVVDRAQLNQVLKEQRLQVSGLVNQKNAANVGQLLGAQALIFLKVLQCDTSRTAESFTDKKKKVSRKYITIGTIRGSLRTVDLTTGRVLASQNLESSGGLESWDAYPEPADVLAQREQSIAFSVHRMFLPWTEKRSVVAYNDKECNLKVAYKQLQARDVEGALASAEAAVAACRDSPGVKDKTLGHAYYNLGLAQFLRKDYQSASASLSEAAKYQGGDIVQGLLTEARAAQQRPDIAYAETAVAGTRPQNRSNPGPSAPAKPASVEERLKQLESLKAKGLVTKEEYDRKRAQIIDGI